MTFDLDPSLSISEPTKWNNYHSETWDGLCATGQSQSPIDIKTRETSGLVMDDFGLDQFSQWLYGGTIENNGHTVKFSPNQEIEIKSVCCSRMDANNNNNIMDKYFSQWFN